MGWPPSSSGRGCWLSCAASPCRPLRRCLPKAAPSPPSRRPSCPSPANRPKPEPRAANESRWGSSMNQSRTFIEVIAPELDQAVARGLQELGLERDDVTVEVLDE